MFTIRREPAYSRAALPCLPIQFAAKFEPRHVVARPRLGEAECPARVHPDGGATESRCGEQRAVADEHDSLSDETLIAYVRGRLPEADAARIAVEATRRPDLAAEIALVRGLAGAADAEADAPVPGELGWARLSRALDAEPARLARRAWGAPLASCGLGRRRRPRLAGGRRAASSPARTGRRDTRRCRSSPLPALPFR